MGERLSPVTSDTALGAAERRATVADLRPDETAVLRDLAGRNPERTYYLRTIAKSTGIPTEYVRLACRRLTDLGLAAYNSGLFDEEGCTAGSGYQATDSGRDLAATLPALAVGDTAFLKGWRQIESAPKDGTYILAVVAGASDPWEHLNGRVFVIRHEGRTVSDHDLGWAVYPGFGGASASWFSHWRPLPALPLQASPKSEA